MALTFTDAVDGIVEFTVAGDDSEFMPTVCVAFVEGVVAGEEAIVGDPTVDVFVTCVTVGIVDVDCKALMFTDAVDGIVEFTVAGDDSEFMPTVCVAFVEGVVAGEVAIVGDPTVDVFVTCVTVGIVEVDWKALVFSKTVCVAFVEGVVAGEEAIVGDPTVDVFVTCVTLGIVDVDWKALMFTDAVDGIVEFIVAGDDSEFMPTVCVAFVEGVVAGEEAIVGDPTVDVFVSCGIDGIVDIDSNALIFNDEVDGIGGFTVTGDDSGFIRTVCVGFGEDAVFAEKATVEDSIVDVFVPCVRDGIGDVD